MKTIASVYSPHQQIERTWVTVFTHDIGDGYCASSVQRDAFGLTEIEAVERVAAHVLEVHPSRLHLEHEAAGIWHVTIAQKPAGRFDMFWAAVALIIVTAAVVGIVAALAEGGAR